MKNRYIPFIALSALLSFNVLAQDNADAQVEVAIEVEDAAKVELSAEDIAAIEAEYGIKLTEKEVALLEKYMARETPPTLGEVMRDAGPKTMLKLTKVMLRYSPETIQHKAEKVASREVANVNPDLIVASEEAPKVELSDEDVAEIESEVGVQLSEEDVDLIEENLSQVASPDTREVKKKVDIKALIKSEAAKIKQGIVKLQANLKEKLKRKPKACEMLPSKFGYLVVTNKKTFGPFASLLPEQKDEKLIQRMLTKVDPKRRSAAEFLNKHCEMEPVDCQMEPVAEGYQITVKEGVAMTFADAQDLLAAQAALEQQKLCNPFPVPQCQIKNSEDGKGFELKIGDKVQFAKVDKSEIAEENIEKLLKLKEMEQSIVDSGFCQSKELDTCSVKSEQSALNRDPRHTLQISSELSVLVQGSNKVEDVAKFIEMRKTLADKGLCLDSGVNQCSMKYSTGDLSHNGIKIINGDAIVGYDYQGMMSHADQFNKLKELTACEVDEEKVQACKVLIAPSDEGEGFDGTISTEGVGGLVVLGNILMQETNDSFENIFMQTGAASMRLMNEKMCASMSVEIIKREDIVHAELEEEVLVGEVVAEPLFTEETIVIDAPHASEEIVIE